MASIPVAATLIKQLQALFTIRDHESSDQHRVVAGEGGAGGGISISRPVGAFQPAKAAPNIGEGNAVPVPINASDFAVN